jgi:Cu+-exporting ATPase
MTRIHRTKLTVQGNSIHCASCEKRIETTLNIQPGILAVETNSSTQEVIVSYDSDQLGLKEITELLEKMGFPASPVSQV